MRNRTMQLEEQKVNYQAQALELEKQRFKWEKFCSKKSRELERMKLENERTKLENGPVPVLPKRASPHRRGAKFSHSSRLSESKTYHHMARTSRWAKFNIGLCCIAKGSTLARGAQAGSWHHR